MEYPVPANPPPSEPPPMTSLSRHARPVLAPGLAAIALLAAVACGGNDAPADTAATAGAARAACFGSRVLSYQTLMAEVVIPSGESCAQGTFTVVFTRGDDTLARLEEQRRGVVGFIGTADVDGDGRGEFFVATGAPGTKDRGELFAYTDANGTIERLPLAALDSAQLEGYDGGDRFGFGGPNQLVRAFPLPSGDSAWFGYSHGQRKWERIDRPGWIR